MSGMQPPIDNNRYIGNSQSIVLQPISNNAQNQKTKYYDNEVSGASNIFQLLFVCVNSLFFLVFIQLDSGFLNSMPGKYRQRSYDNLKTGELLEKHLCTGKIYQKPLPSSNTMHIFKTNQLKTIQQQTKGLKQEIFKADKSNYTNENHFDRLPLLLKTTPSTRLSPLKPMPEHVIMQRPSIPAQYQLCIPQKKVK